MCLIFCQLKLNTSVSGWIAALGESFYHVLETVESSLVEPEDESVSKTFDSHNVTETTGLHGLYLCSI